MNAKEIALKTYSLQIKEGNDYRMLAWSLSRRDIDNATEAQKFQTPNAELRILRGSTVVKQINQ